MINTIITKFEVILMAKQTIDIGVQGNDGTGDSIRDSFNKVNQNFTEIYAVFKSGGTIPFSALSDAPTYGSNQIIMASTAGDKLTARKVVAGAGIRVDATDNTKITISAAIASIVGDMEPALGSALNANFLAIGRVAAPSQTLVDSFNAIWAGNGVTTTLNDLPVTVGYGSTTYITKNPDGTILGALTPRAQPLLPQTTAVGYDATLTSNYLATEAMQRKDVVYRGGDTMSGPLYLSDHPAPLTGYTGANGVEDLQAATKFYVDNNTFVSNVNLYVSTSGDDSQLKTPYGKEGRGWQFAYKSLGAAASHAENLINLSSQESGPYTQRMAYTIGPTQYNSTVQSVVLANGNTGSTDYIDAYNLLQANKVFIQQETIAYINKKYVNIDVYDKTQWSDTMQFIITAIADDLLRGTTYNSHTVISKLYSNSYSTLLSDQLSQTISAVSFALAEVLNFSYSSGNLEIYIGNIITAICYDVAFKSNYQSIKSALNFPYASVGLTSAEFIALIDPTIISVTSASADGMIATITFNDQTITPYAIGQSIVISGMTPIGYNGTFVVTASTSASVMVASTMTAPATINGHITSNNIAYSILSLSNITASPTINDFVVSRLNLIKNIINGVAAPVVSIPNLGHTDIGLSSARDLLISNIAFCKAEITAFLRSNYSSLTYDLLLSKRDIQYIIESLTYDFMYGGNSQSVYAGSRYWNGSASYLQSYELTACTASLVYLNTIIQAIIINQPLATQYQTDIQQYTNDTLTGGTEAASSISANISIISSIMNTNVLPSILQPLLSDIDPVYLGTYTQLLANITVYETQAVAYVNTNFYIINDPVILANITTLFQITLDALVYGYTIPSLTTALTAITYTTPVGITNEITDARNAIIANSQFIIDENAAWILSSYPSFDYNGAPVIGAQKSARDVASLISAICYDITYGGNSASVYAAQQFWVSGNTVLSNQTVCLAAIDHIRSMVISLSQNNTVSPIYSSTPQVTDPLYADGSYASVQITSLFDIITDIIANNTTYATTELTHTLVYPTSIYDSATNEYKAHTVMLSNATTIANNTVSYIESTYKGGFNYNESLCYRDLGYIIDAMSIDLITGGTWQSINAGKSFYKNSSAKSIAIGTDLVESVDGITFAKNLGIQILNKTVATRYQSLYTQIITISGTLPSALINVSGGTSTPSPTSTSIGVFTTNMTTILDIINKGVSIAATPSFGSGIWSLTVSNGGNGFVDQGAPGDNHIIPGKVVVGSLSKAYANIVTYTIGNNLSVDTITARLTKPGLFVVGDNIDFGETVSDLNITIFVETGVYYEDYPIRLPPNCTISGNDFRRTIIRPLDRVSQSPWRNVFFYRDSIIDGLQLGLIDYSTDFASTASVSATIAGITGVITITLSNNFQVPANWVGRVFTDATSDTGIAGKAYINTVSGNTLNCTIIYPFVVTTTYADGTWYVYGTANYGRHYLTNPTLVEGAVQSTFIGTIAGTTLTISSITTGEISVGQVIYGTGVASNTKIISGIGTSWVVSISQYVSITAISIINTAKNNTEIDVFLTNDASRIRLITCQGHGGFMMVLDPTGQIKTKSPYAQDAACFTKSINRQHFAGGQLVDGFAGRLFGNISAIYNLGVTVSVTGGVNSGLDIRSPQVPSAFYVAGTRYQIDDVVSWSQNYDGSGNIIGGTAVLTLDTVTPFYLNNAYNTPVFTFSTMLADTLTCLAYDMVLGSNYQSVKMGLTYLRGQNVLPALGSLLVVQGLQYASSLLGPLAIDSYGHASINTNYTTILNMFNNGVSATPVISYPTPTGLSSTSGRVHTVAILQANKAFIEQEITSWLAANYNTQIIPNYSAALSQRDIGYIIDAICYDVLYGGNSSVYEACAAFYSAGISQIFGDEPYCAAAFIRLSTILQQIILNLAITNSAGNQLLQDTALSAATSSEQATIGGLISLLIDYVVEGTFDNDVIALLITNTSTTLTVSNNSSLVTGATISGNGILNGTTISSVTPGTGEQLGTSAIVISNAATITGTYITLTLSGAGATIPVHTRPTITGQASNLVTDFYNLIAGIANIQSQTIIYLNTGANLGINIEMAGNKSMLASDFTQINDLAYGVICTNAAITEQVSTFTYYCYTGYWAANGGQIRSIGGSNATGVYGLRATGYDVTELPDSVNLAYNMMQSAHVYKQGLYSTSMTPTASVQALAVYVINYEYVPFNLSEIEIDHTVVGGTISRYIISTIVRTGVTVAGGVVLQLNLSTAGLNGTSSSGLTYPLYDGQIVTIRVLQNAKFNNINNVRPVRPSTALQYNANLAAVYRIISYVLIESTGEEFATNSGVAILSTDSSYSYIQLTTDTGNLSAADPSFDASATIVSGSTSSTTITVLTSSITGSIGIGYALGGVGFTTQKVVTVTSASPNTTIVLSAFPSITPVGPVHFSSRTQGSLLGDLKISVLTINNTAIVNELQLGTYLIGWNGRTHRIINYVPPTYVAIGSYAAYDAGTLSLQVTSVSGTIVVGDIVTGAGFNGLQTVVSFITTTSGSTTGATVILSAVASSTPSGSISFGVSTTGYITLDPNPVYNNSAIGTSVLAMTYQSQVLQTGSITSKIITFNMPYNVIGVLPPVDSFMRIANNTNINYNGNYQVVATLNTTQISTATTASLLVGMSISTITTNSYIPSGTIIQSIDSTTQFTVSPACWVATGASVVATLVAYVTGFTINNGGSGYTVAPLIVVTGGGSPTTTAILTCTISNGVINSVVIANPGYGYTSIPTIVLSQVLNNASISVTISTNPTVTVTTTGGISNNTISLLYPSDPGIAGNVTAVASSGHNITLSTSINLYINNVITFSGTVFGNLVAGTSYYILTINTGTNQITVSTVLAGSVFDPGTASGSAAFYTPSYSYGGALTVTSFGSVTYNTGANNYSVKLNFGPTTAPTIGAYFKVTGNTNNLYNGYFLSTASSTSSVTLTYPLYPGTWSTATTTTIAKETTSGSSNTLGISKPLTPISAITLRAGCPSGTPAQVTVRISTCRASGHDFLDIGVGGYNTSNYPTQIYGNPSIPANSSNQVLEENVGRVFYVSTDQDGIFKVGRFFQVDQGTGTVTFSASIALSNIDGLGFKRGVAINEFSTDTTMIANAADVVPVQSAVRSFIDYRLGLDYGGSIVPPANLIGPGYLPLNGIAPMKGNLNLGNNYISNLYMATSGTSPYDGANRNYVDTNLANFNSFYKMSDVLITAAANGNYVIYDSASSKWKNIALPTGDVNVTYGSGVLTTTIQASRITNTMVSATAAIAQSKLAMTAASTLATAAGITQANLGLSSFDSTLFTATNGWITITPASVTKAQIVNVNDNTLLGRFGTGTAGSVQETTAATVVTSGDGVKNASFSTTNAVTSNVNSVAMLALYNGSNTSANTYGVVGVSAAHAANSLVKTDSSGIADVAGLKIGGNIAIGAPSTTLQFTTQGGYTFLSSVGSVSTNTTTTFGGTVDMTAVTLISPTIIAAATNPSASAATLTGQWRLTAGSLLDLNTSSVTLKAYNITTNGTDTGTGTIQGNWTLTGASRLQATYADLAEYYEGDFDYAPGTIVVFGGSNEVTSSTTLNDTRVAGVVTTNPAYVMNNGQKGIKVCVALAGRVPCKVIGKIRKGDLLTTSNAPGYAIKANDPKLGAIIGKALENKDTGEAGIIEIAVGRA